MCGFTGFKLSDRLADAPKVVESMADAIVTRGPDGQGIWFDETQGIYLAHRRLSILDLSAAGKQPMCSADGRFVIAFNGEIYNHLDIRTELEMCGSAPEWRGHSDTETMLAAFSSWGIEETLPKLTGMFAFALWDNVKRELLLVRDRLGEKPLYYGWLKGAFAFASELKALRVWPYFRAAVSHDALLSFLQKGYVSSPLSIYQGIFKLPPGCLLRLRHEAADAPGNTPPAEGHQCAAFDLRRWWSLADSVERGLESPIEDPEEALELLESTLRRSVKMQTIADVPIGAFLSGGIDSSTVVALLQAQSDRQVKTFTIGFTDRRYDESEHARAVANHLGTDHHEVMVSPKDAQDVIPLLPVVYDEPFADASQIPTYLVSKIARRDVTVVLSGDGGDELFAGYNRHLWGQRVWNQFTRYPAPLRKVMGRGILAVPHGLWDTIGNLRGGSAGVRRLGEKAHKVGRQFCEVNSADDLYAGFVMEWRSPDVLATGLELSPSCPPAPTPHGLTDVSSLMMYRDTLGYLPDDILCKVDRASMANSLETRVPFLNHHVVDLAWRLPIDLKMRDGIGKWPLREILYRHVPRSLIDRPKSGFSIPIGDWLRGPLREWAESLLGNTSLNGYDLLRPQAVRTIWMQHLSGQHDWTNRLWFILMFLAWSNDSLPSKPISSSCLR